MRWWVEKSTANERHDHGRGNRVLRHLIAWYKNNNRQLCFVFGSMYEFGVRSTACWCGSATNVNTHILSSSQINFRTQCSASYCYTIRTRKERRKEAKSHTSDDCASEMTWTIITFLKWLNKFTCPCRFAVFNGLLPLFASHTDYVFVSFRLCCFRRLSPITIFNFFPLHEKLFGSLFHPFSICCCCRILGGNYSHKLTIQLMCVHVSMRYFR